MNAVPLECFNTERGSMLEESNQTPVVGIISYAEEFIMNNSESYMDGSSSEDWNASCSSYDDDRWQKEFKIHENFMPSELKIEFYDVMVLYSENNRADARKFCDHLKTDIKLDNDICVKAALYDESVHEAGPRFRLLEIAMKRSTYIFFFITKEFCSDTWIELSREECLMEAIDNKEKQWCVVPVYTENPKDSNFKIPVGVRALKGIDYYLNNFFYRIGVRELIQNRLHQRLEKERKQKYEQNIWLQKNKKQLSIENIKSPENMEKMETQQEMEQKIKGKDVNEVLTGASQEHQRSTTYQGSENCFNMDQNSQAWEHQSQENDMTVNNSMQYVDHSFQEKNYNLTESSSQGPPVFGNLPNMSMLESQDSRMATGTMNLFNEDTKPLQGENPTGASHDKTGLPDFDALTLNTSLDWMNLMSNDQSETSDKTSSPLSQKSRGKADANTASMVFNIYHVENFQLGKNSSINKLMQTEEKSKNEADNSNTVTENMVYNEHNGEDSQKPVDLPIPDSRSLAELKDAAELKDEPVSVGNHQDSRQRQDCRNHSSRNVNGLKLSLLLKNKTEAEEGQQTLETSLKADIESWEEEGCDTEVNMRDQYSHLGARPKNPQKKPVGKASPCTVVPLAPLIRKIPDRNVVETALNTVDEASSNETGVRTVQDTSLKHVAEPKTTKRDSNDGEKLWSDVNQYQVTWRSAAPLLARAFPFISLMSNSTDQDHFSQDEVD